jgi:hypothetical protein
MMGFGEVDRLQQALTNAEPEMCQDMTLATTGNGVWQHTVYSLKWQVKVCDWQ